MIALTAFPPKSFGPAKLAVQVTTCLSSASEISHSKEVTLSTSSAAVDWKSIIIIPLRSKNFCPTGLLKGLPSVSPIRPFFLVVAVVWCARSSKREEVGRFSSFHLTIGHGQLTSHVKMKTLLMASSNRFIARSNYPTL